MRRDSGAWGAQEFDLPDVMRLWDSLLTDRQRFSFLTYFCAAVVLSIRDELIEHNDFAFCVKVCVCARGHVSPGLAPMTTSWCDARAQALQRFDGRVPLEKLLAGAYDIYEQDHPASTRR